ncbi:MAG: zinc ribbon domain-containing protein [Chitinophagaceae bacterium]|nr:zinc ribbon domain-containing protein [Chitinophagaceae bacterium]
MQRPEKSASQKIQLKQAAKPGKSMEHEHLSGEACPSCNAPTKPGADICEACGTWLLQGKCRFCYAPFKSGQKFCGSCGNPPEGTNCKSCGTFTQFDFCPRCESPVSRRAAPFLEQLLANPELKKMQQEIQELPSTPSPQSDVVAKNNIDIQNELEKYFAKLEQKQPGKPASSSFEITNENRDFSQELQNSEESMVQQIAQLSKENREIALQKIRELQDRAFSSNQEARLFYMSIKHAFPKLRLNVCDSFLGWQCVFTKSIHTDGPSGCARPEMGGRWICSDGVNWNSAHDEFDYDGVTYRMNSDPE